MKKKVSLPILQKKKVRKYFLNNLMPIKFTSLMKLTNSLKNSLQKLKQDEIKI